MRASVQQQLLQRAPVDAVAVSVGVFVNQLS